MPFPLSPRLRKALFGAVAAASGAIATGLWTSFSERPRPAALITDVSISASYSSRFGRDQVVSLPLKDDFFKHLETSAWVTSLREPTEDLDTVIETLTDDKKHIDKLIQDLGTFGAEENELRQSLAAMPSIAAAEAFFDKWEPLDGMIHGAIKGRLGRGQMSPPPEKDYGKKTQYLLMDTTYRRLGDQDIPIVVVSKRGGKYGSMMTYEPRNEKEARVAKTIMPSALAFFDTEILGQFLDVIHQELDSLPLQEQLKADLADYIRGFSRWTVSVLISNAGNRPISFSPSSVMYISTRGVDGFAKNIAIPLESRDEGGVLAPLTVNGGESRIFTLVSTDLVINVDSIRWREIVTLFDKRALFCFVDLRPEADPWYSGGSVSSPVRPFGPSTNKDFLGDVAISEKFEKK